MKLEAVGKPFTYRWPGGEIRLEPGVPVDVPDDRAVKLLAKVGAKVRAVQSDVVIEPATRPDGNPISPVYWEDATGKIVGPAVPECLAHVGAEFWMVTTFAGHTRWIRSDRLRSIKAFLEQAEVREGNPFAHSKIERK
jgi:hypothetical protein